MADEYIQRIYEDKWQSAVKKEGLCIDGAPFFLVCCVILNHLSLHCMHNDGHKKVKKVRKWFEKGTCFEEECLWNDNESKRNGWQGMMMGGQAKGGSTPDKISSLILHCCCIPVLCKILIL